MKMEKRLANCLLTVIAVSLAFLPACSNKKKSETEKSKASTAITVNRNASKMSQKKVERVYKTVSGILRLIPVEGAPLGKVAIWTDERELVFVYGPPYSNMLRDNIGKSITVTGELLKDKQRYNGELYRSIILDSSERIKELDGRPFRAEG